jgi:alkanesulfonate monooxygenase SsuD/methylene tetrahydromethanopterin reductase-like flavin-dependent oxidoreductase (luciferase family)
MAKNREDRYQSTEDLLEDLRAVRRGEPPTHARRDVHVDGLTALEETGKTVDIAPPATVLTWTSPPVLAVLGVAAASILINLILLILYTSK